ncbi:Heat shock protein HSP 90-alpha 1 [Nosema bombycis CQ1]|uniref:Heat shock protein HSP 90-alpha 1 n=2 Tax=Nosema bombycis (strain CQ1 / CVCC 102059) TaxID=578461 RepID=R0M436_NOSB1|nr:Heat shock protein HSP 90-alpha 1 [Nosema bombycis CQ1]|eukprot:EOB12779.1 Heat shock protein HSP 90-alpha 1 [Nosema bombycis CQ1]
MSEKSKEQFQFDVDTNQLMDIIIKSVYSSNEIFLRELISNSNDACDKLKTMYMDLSEKGFKVDNASSLEIEIIPDLVNKTLTIKDNGIGMKKSDLISFIGTIANSGTRKFKEALEQKSESTDISHLIGQFGVGFYSSYLVAEQVDIVTRHPEDGAYLWSSNGRDTYSISDYEGEDFNHGTSVILYMKEGNEEYLQSKRLIELVKKHSNFILYPISVYEEKEREVKVDGDDQPKDDEAKEEPKDDQEPKEPKDTDEPKIEEVTEKDNIVMKKEKYIEKTKINTDRPLWERKLKDVSEEDLTSFYKNISGDWDSFLAVDQWTVEGMLTLKLLLFIPKRSRMDFFGGKNKKNKNIKLYCNNVFVTDDFGDNIPEWMNFVVGVVASSDISMNVSRELIQGSSLMKLVKKTLPQKVLDMINKLSNDQEKYSSFYNEFGNCLKLAVMEAQDNQREKFVNTLRYSTNKNENISFKKYLENMPEKQKQIYVLTGLNKESCINNPFLESFKDYEVILMDDPMDEVMLRNLKNYQEKPIQRITSEGVELPEEDKEKNDELIKEFESLNNKIKEILGNEVEKVIINNRLGEVPCVISTTKYSNSNVMESIMSSQLVAEKNPLAAMTALSKKIFEINPNHGITKGLRKLLENNEEEKLKDTVSLLFQTTQINCGFVMKDPSTYCKMVYKQLGSE